MSIRARLHQSGAITVHYEPNWLARLFGAKPADYEADWNGVTWVTEHGKLVSYAAHKAIERALTKQAVEKRFEVGAREMLKR